MINFFLYLKCLTILDQVRNNIVPNKKWWWRSITIFVDIEYLPFIQGDAILDSAKYGGFKAVIKAVIKKSPEQIKAPTLDHNGNETAGTYTVWLPKTLLDDFKKCNLWPVVMLGEYGEIDEVYLTSTSFSK